MQGDCYGGGQDMPQPKRKTKTKRKQTKSTQRKPKQQNKSLPLTQATPQKKIPTSTKKKTPLHSCAPSKNNICDSADAVQRKHNTRFICLFRCYGLILASTSLAILINNILFVYLVSMLDCICKSRSSKCICTE